MATRKKKLIELGEQTVLLYMKIKVSDIPSLEDGKEVKVVDSRSGNDFILKLS